MQSTAQRKEAIRKYKEQKVPAGIFAVRCGTSGQIWVGASPNLNAARNSISFSLRMGGCTNKAFQAEWNAQGLQDTLNFEVLETLKDDLLPMTKSDLLKEKKAQWLTKLGAKPF